MVGIRYTKTNYSTLFMALIYILLLFLALEAIDSFVNAREMDCIEL